MVRLIDADELHEIINWTSMKPPFSRKAVHRFIDTARTVEAIPIEWIEQYGRENWYDFGTQHNAITEMLKAWREKNDKTD